MHPFAHQPTPFERLQEICTNLSETSLFVTYEAIVWILDKLWGLLINLILLPIAVLGLFLDYIRKQARHVSNFTHSLMPLTLARVRSAHADSETR